MKAFYSIVYCAIRPNVDEKVSIGLLWGDETRFCFRYSPEKLSLVRQMVSPDAYNLIKTALKSLSKVALESGNDSVLGSAYKGQSALKESYISYLSSYANNLVSYSNPSSIDLEFSESNYRKLFEKFVFHYSFSGSERVKPVELVRKRLTKSLSKHVAFDVELDKSKVPGLILPAKVWFIGKNEVQVTGEAKDFSAAVHILQQQLNAHLFLLEKLKEMPTGKHGKYFMIGDEPDKLLSENHSLWSSLRQSAIVEMVPTDEVGRIEEYMEAHGVEPVYQD